jgi:hypothetical protein
MEKKYAVQNLYKIYLILGPTDKLKANEAKKYDF